MRENLKEMIESLEGESIVLDLVGNDETTIFFKRLHSYIDNRDYIILEDKEDVNEFKYAFPVGTVMNVNEEYGEYLVCRNTGTDYKISINN